MKEFLITGPVLAKFHPERETIVEADFSGYATRGLLLQKDDDQMWKPVAFFSKKHSIAEVSYPIHDMELLVIVDCLTAWEPELKAVEKFQVLTDHKNFKHFYSEKQLSERQVRWSEFLSRLNFTLE